MEIVTGCREFPVTSVSGADDSKRRKTRVLLRPTSLARVPTSELPQDMQGTSPGLEPVTSLSPYDEAKMRDRLNVKLYRRVSTRSQTQSCIEIRQWLDANSADDIISEQGKDRKISVVIGWKAESNERPNWEHVSHLDADYKTYWSQWNRLIVKDSILYRRWVNETTGHDHLELVVPEPWCNEIIRMFHADPGAGHMGVKPM